MSEVLCRDGERQVLSMRERERERERERDHVQQPFQRPKPTCGSDSFAETDKKSLHHTLELDIKLLLSLAVRRKKTNRKRYKREWVILRCSPASGKL